MSYIDKITQEVVQVLQPRSYEVVKRRFGLVNDEPQTLEAIALPLGITRERVRQIQEESLDALTAGAIKNKNLLKLVDFARDSLSDSLGVSHSDDLARILIEKFGKEDDSDGAQRKVVFLLRLAPESIFYHPEDEDYYHFFALNLNRADEAKKKAKKLQAFFEKESVVAKDNILDVLENIFMEKKISAESALRFIRILKNLDENPYSEIGLKDHPRINPKNTRDRVYITLLKHGNPMHFRDLAEKLNKFARNEDNLNFHKTWQKEVHHQTVHNDLIRDPRFVLIGRGIYALKEWNYKSGTVKDILIDVLKANKEMTSGDIVKEVLRQRLVKPATILINLNDKRTFIKKSSGKYALK